MTPEQASVFVPAFITGFACLGAGGIFGGVIGTLCGRTEGHEAAQAEARAKRREKRRKRKERQRVERAYEDRKARKAYAAAHRGDAPLEPRCKTNG